MCGGSSAKTDRTTQLFAEGKLRDLGNTLTGQGSDLISKGATATSRGLEDTEKASKYYSDILSGDPTKVMAAARPEINAITSAADKDKKDLANLGGARTGGENAVSQDISAKTRGQVGDLLAKERSSAAGGVERTGAETSKVGLAQTGEGLGAEGQAEGAFATLSSDAIKSRELSQQIHDSAVQQWADLVAAVLVGS